MTIVLATLLSLLPAPQDVLIVIGDDIAVDDLAAVDTPNLDRIAARGVTFTNAFGCPVCSPSRRSLVFGEYYFHDSGLGCTQALGIEPPLEAVSLAELAPIPSAIVGKWHLGANPAGGPWELAPQAHGFLSWEAGHPMNVAYCTPPPFGGNYFSWLRVEAGRSSFSTVYEPFAVRSEAASWWRSTRGPKLMVVAPQLAHGPFHRPPPSLAPPDLPEQLTERQEYEAMIYALDRVVGELEALAGPDDTFLFVCDNGTPSEVSPDPARSKETTFERGIHVPMIARGPLFPRGVTDDRLAHVVDVYATVGELLAVPWSGDGLPLFSEREHDVVFSGNIVDETSDVCARSRDLKLRISGTHEELYDLVQDPGEHTDVHGQPVYAARERELRRRLDRVLARESGGRVPPASRRFSHF